MKSIVIELQKLATDENVSITKLLRKALVVTTKLNLIDFKEWIKKELKGYKDVKDVPEYRNIIGELKAWNPYNGIWLPLIWTDAPEGAYDRKIIQRISELEYNLKSSKDKLLQILLSPEQQNILIKAFNPPSTPVLIIPETSIVGILDTVRNIILEWSLKLEKEGILGEEMIFTEDEKIKARNNQEIRIVNFYGILGNTFTGTVSQEVNIAVKNNDLESLLKYLKSKEISNEDLEDLKQSIKIDPAPKQKNKLGKNVSKWIGKMIEKASSGAWNIGLSIAVNTLTNAICNYYGLK